MEENLNETPELTGEDTAAEELPKEQEPETREETLGERLERLEQRIAEREAELEAIRRDSALRDHFRQLEKGAGELQKELPDFDLMQALEDPEFLRLTSPSVGLGVEAAYHALHFAELKKAAEEQAVARLREAIRLEAGRPEENGTVRRGAASSQPGSYRSMSPEERAVQKRLILAGQKF